MAGLTVEKFEGGTGWVLTQYDEQIDWQRSKCSQSEFANDPDKHRGDLAWVDGADPIRIYFHYPSRTEVSMAYREAGADLASKAALAEKVSKGQDPLAIMTDDDILDSLAAAVELARMCIDRVTNYDGWPGDDSAHERLGRLRRLRADVLPEAVLEDVGLHVFQQSALKSSTGKPSASPAGGPLTPSGAGTGTDATGRTDAEPTRHPDEPGAAKRQSE